MPFADALRVARIVPKGLPTRDTLAVRIFVRFGLTIVLSDTIPVSS